jgi:altronate dehydratase large subunit
VVPLQHGHGCGRGGDDLGLHFKTLANLARNPNVQAVLVVGLGCEVIKAEYLAERISHSGKPAEFFNIQDVGGSRRAAAKGTDIVRRMLADAAGQKRSAFPLQEVVLGLECGGSDAFSGVTANPSVGLAADWLVGEGGTAIFSENHGDDRYQPYPGAALKGRGGGTGDRHPHRGRGAQDA